MAILKYEGSLGKFEYNGDEFEIVINEDAREQLVYKSKEAVDFPPNLPEGLVDGTGVFAGSNIKHTLQTYPKSLEKTDFMYSDCHNIKSTGKIPAVKSSNSMYSGSSIETAEDMPDSITDSAYMFDECRNLKSIGKLSKGLQKAECMFGNCKLLTDISVDKNDEILQSLENKNFIFINCDSLDESLKIEYDDTYLYDDMSDGYDSFNDMELNAEFNTNVNDFINTHKIDVDMSGINYESSTYKRRDLEIEDDELDADNSVDFSAGRL